MERYVVEGDILLIKLWLEVGQQEQERRFEARIDDPLRQWKLSQMDIESYQRWYDYSKATHSKHTPSYSVCTVLNLLQGPKRARTMIRSRSRE
jgi:polyphosphate kinase 2 (PPK2 family)